MPDCCTALLKTARKWLLWPFAASYVRMPGKSYRGIAPAFNAADSQSETNLRKHIHTLANVIGERHFGCPEKLHQCAAYLQGELSALGYQPELHEFVLPEGCGTNIIATVPGRSKRVMIIGAHYDSVPGSPAANDNGSGVAATLELARMFRSRTDLELTLRFVFFSNEEHVGTPAEHMGSYHYAKSCYDCKDEIVGMWSLETLGYYTDEPDSQHYPSPFDLFFGTTGDFVGFIGDEKSIDWIRKSIGAFRASAKIPSEGAAGPSRFKDITRSDHWAFTTFGYQSLMITDTANFRYPHYHTAGDTADRVNFTQLVRVVSGLANSIHTIDSAL